MHAEHAVLLDQLRKVARPIRRDQPPQNDSYGGSGRPFFNVSVPDRRAIVKRWLAAHKPMSSEEFFAVVDSLTEGESHEPDDEEDHGNNPQHMDGEPEGSKDQRQNQQRQN